MEVRARALGGLSEDSQRGTTAYLRLDDFEVERGLAKDSTLDPKVAEPSNRNPKPWFRDLRLEKLEVGCGLSLSNEPKVYEPEMQKPEPESLISRPAFETGLREGLPRVGGW